jgi:hypothetical protein
MLPASDAMPRVPVREVRAIEYWPCSVAFDVIPEITAVTRELLLLSVTDVAMMVTVPPAGAETGAV